jgi:hypothetical protein
MALSFLRLLKTEAHRNRPNALKNENYVTTDYNGGFFSFSQQKAKGHGQLPGKNFSLKCLMLKMGSSFIELH